MYRNHIPLHSQVSVLILNDPRVLKMTFFLSNIVRLFLHFSERDDLNLNQCVLWGHESKVSLNLYAVPYSHLFYFFKVLRFHHPQ